MIVVLCHTKNEEIKDDQNAHTLTIRNTTIKARSGKRKRNISAV